MSQVLPVEKIKLGLIVVADELSSSLPLEHTDVVAQVIGPLASVSVTQRFGNPLNEPAEIDYLFPLPHEASVIDFQLRVGERIIQGDLQELEQARETYQRAVEEGKRAGLLEERRPNLFAVRIANILPGETITAVMRYQMRLAYDDGDYEFVFPMGLTPRYQDPEHPEESAGVDAPLASQEDPIGPVELSLSVDAGAPVGDPTSPSHPLQVTRLDPRRFAVRLAGEHIPDHDFVLRYPVAREAVTAAVWLAEETKGETFLLTVLPPALDEEASPPPREFIFVLDRSGSMSGQPMAQARNALRACLRTLNPADLFSILVFDHEVAWFQSKPRPINQKWVDRADSFLTKLEGRGGTQIVPALNAALTLPADRERLRYVVFLTDGAVSAEERAYDQVRRHLGKARLFTFGIGPSVNRALLARLARLGRGTAEFLQLSEDIEGAIIRFQDRVSFPVLTDLALEWSGAKPWDVLPASLPDLYSGQPLEMVGHLKRSSRRQPKLTVRGQRAGVPVEMTVKFPAAAEPEPIISRAWARARVDDLLEQESSGRTAPHKIRTEIIALALEQNLVTPHTAFVAVDSEVATEDGKPRTIHVAQPLPQGLDLEGFVGTGANLMRGAPPHQAMAMAMPVSGGMRRKSAPRIARFAAKLADEVMELRAVRQPEQAYLPALGQVDETLRWLARSQRVNGSWQDNVETTAAVLLAFVRAGHTTKDGHYRQLIRRAFSWLSGRPASGIAAAAQLVALAELAQATGSETHLKAVEGLKTKLGAPSGGLMGAAFKRAESPASPVSGGPGQISSLNDLRLAAVCAAGGSVPADAEIKGEPSLVRAWSAALAAAQG